MVLIKAEELYREINENKDIIIVDVRGFPSYVSSHIPKAYWFYVWDLTKHKEGLPSALKDINEICKVLEKNGFDSEKDTRIYCDINTVTHASYLFFVLEYLGFEKVKILEGGFEKWKEKGYPVMPGIVKPKEGKVIAKIKSEIKADFNYINSVLNNPRILLIDTRTPEEFYGKVKSALKEGRIPGSINLDHKKFLTLYPYYFENLKLEEIDLKNKEIILYCSAGDRATYVYFILNKILGINNIKVYLESFYDWVLKNGKIEK